MKMELERVNLTKNKIVIQTRMDILQTNCICRQCNMNTCYKETWRVVDLRYLLTTFFCSGISCLLCFLCSHVVWIHRYSLHLLFRHSSRQVLLRAQPVWSSTFFDLLSVKLILNLMTFLWRTIVCWNLLTHEQGWENYIQLCRRKMMKLEESFH